MLRQEAGVALLASLIVRAMGGDADMKTFLPYSDDDVLDDTPENLARLMRGEG